MILRPPPPPTTVLLLISALVVEILLIPGSLKGKESFENKFADFQQLLERNY
jgi:hypothetical protein